MRSLFLAIIIAVGFTVGTTSSAHADILFSTVGSACTIDTPYVANAFVSSTNGSVSFASGKTGYITLTCQVPRAYFNTCTGSAFLYHTTLDSDGSGTNGHVSTWFNSLSWGIGTTVSNLTHVDSLSTSKGAQYSAGFSAASVDYFSNYYWVSVEMYRANTSTNEVF